MTAGPEEHVDLEAATHAALVRSLGGQRRHVLGIVEGLSDEQLRATMLPSGWSCLGLIQHLTRDVEHYWFSVVMGDEPLDEASSDRDDATESWQVEHDVRADSVLAAYGAAIEAADRVIGATPLDAPPKKRDPWWGEWSVPDLRFVLLHVIAETACHAGHLDAARELIDGTQWLTL